MRATVMYGAHDVRVEIVPDARLVELTDTLVRVTRACICGSDLWPYNSMTPSETGNRMGHEFVGIVEAVGSDVRRVKKGDLVVAPFAWSDGTCEFCQQGLQTSCLHGGWWGGARLDGGQGEAVRAYIEELLPDVLEGRIEPGRVFDRVTDIHSAARPWNGKQSAAVEVQRDRLSEARAPMAQRAIGR
ncbi:MAG TPA: alcohol dehydrogenase catalytic domain-containing protein [Vicinamibacterales bacterium]|jgi:threonine dehydrogenase-like Zn-dependent dehydrogenase